MTKIHRVGGFLNVTPGDKFLYLLEQIDGIDLALRVASPGQQLHRPVSTIIPILTIMKSFPYMDSLFIQPDVFCKGLYYAFMSYQDEVVTLFSGRMSILIDKVVRKLMDHYPPTWETPRRRKSCSPSFYRARRMS